MKHEKILLADDDPQMLATLSEFLRGLGFAVSAVSDGWQAMETLKVMEFHLALLDLKLPGYSGLDLLSYIKANAPRTEVILFTGHGGVDSAVQALRLGAYDYLMKSDLLRHVREEHDRWWARYDRLYERGGHIRGNGNGRRPDALPEYTPAAEEILTRCRAHDNLFNGVATIDLTTVKDFGSYCRLVFLEIQKLKPAFPGSAVSVGVLDQTARELRKFVMKQHEELRAR